MNRGCMCPHHWVNKVMMALIWIAGIIFFWTSMRMTAFWGFESPYYAWVVVVLSLMNMNCKYCGCCGSGCGCSCGDCEGGKCGGEHGEGHKHM